MEIIGKFGQWSGLLINWDMSVLLPVDPLYQSFSPDSTPLQIVQQFKYLGITVSSHPPEFLELNLIPLLNRLSSKVDTWCRLPLSVIGRSKSGENDFYAAAFVCLAQCSHLDPYVLL